MDGFIETESDSFVSVSAVEKAVFDKDSRKVRLYGPIVNGERSKLGECFFPGISEAVRRRQVIPAAPGTMATVLGVCEPELGEEPGHDPIQEYRTSVIGWEISSDPNSFPKPILIEPSTGYFSVTVLVDRGDGTLVDAEGKQTNSLAYFRRELLDYYKRELEGLKKERSASEEEGNV
jgi:hypothetical protein